MLKSARVCIAIYPYQKLDMLIPGVIKPVVKKDIKGRVRDDIVQGDNLFDGFVAWDEKHRWKVITSDSYLYIGTRQFILDVIEGKAKLEDSVPVKLVEKALNVGAKKDYENGYVYREKNDFIAWYTSMPIEEGVLLAPVTDLYERAQDGVWWLAKSILESIKIVINQAIQGQSVVR